MFMYKYYFGGPFAIVSACTIDLNLQENYFVGHGGSKSSVDILVDRIVTNLFPHVGLL